MTNSWRGRFGTLKERGLRVLHPWKWPFHIDSIQEIERTIGGMPTAPIPRVIHQIWLGPRRPPLYTMESCRQVNPGWLRVVWTDDNLPPILNRSVFDGFGATYYAKADVLRYEILQRFGGVYVDADQLCLRGFDDLLRPDVEFFAGYQNLGNPDLDEKRRRATLVSNGIIGASPHHPILERVIRDVGASCDDDGLPWIRVGPAALTRAIEETPARAVIHPFHEFYPYHSTETIPAVPEQMLKAIHYRSHAVSLWGTTLGNWKRCREPAGRPASMTETPRVTPEFAAAHPVLPAIVYHERSQ